MNIGIDQLSFYTPHYYLELATLAAQHHIDPDKYRLGIGQERMSIPPARRRHHQHGRKRCRPHPA